MFLLRTRKTYIQLIILFVYLFPVIVIGQFMPLDTDEMQNRVNPVRSARMGSDSLINQVGIDISLYAESHPSVFIVPYFQRQIQNHLSFHYKSIITNNPDYGPRIGSRYERSGEYTGSKKPGDFSTLEAYFLYQRRFLSIKAGKFNQAETNSSRIDIQNNIQLPPVYGLAYHFYLGIFKYSQAHYFLGYSSEDDFSSGYSRYYATQKISFQSNNLDISIGDRVIYSGIDQAVNWRYLAPFDPFLLDVFNFGAPTNNDNHAIDLSLAFNTHLGLRFVSKIVIDEFEIDSADRLTNDDDWGSMVSATYDTKNLFLKQISLRYLYASDYLGIHYEKSTNYEISGLPIFSEFGPQTKRVEIEGYYQVFNQQVEGWFAIYNQQSGKNKIIGSRWNPKATEEDLESWEYTMGIETEVLLKISDRYFSFLSVNIDNQRKTTFRLSFAYSICDGK
jgi:hypothetical protein